MAASVVNVRVDENIKKDIEKLFDGLGMNISTAVNMFFKQCLMEQGLPYQPKLKGRRLTTAERLAGYQGGYEAKEWDTGGPVGKEVF
jgi:DNA-damage-inducible protein J